MTSLGRLFVVGLLTFVAGFGARAFLVPSSPTLEDWIDLQSGELRGAPGTVLLIHGEAEISDPKTKTAVQTAAGQVLGVARLHFREGPTAAPCEPPEFWKPGCTPVEPPSFTVCVYPYDPTIARPTGPSDQPQPVCTTYARPEPIVNPDPAIPLPADPTVATPDVADPS